MATNDETKKDAAAEAVPHARGKAPLVLDSADDSPIAKVLRAVDKVNEHYGESLDGLSGALSDVNGELSTLQDAWTRGQARLQLLEDKVFNPSQRYVSKFATGTNAEEERRQAACRWMIDNYRSRGQWGSSEDGMQWRANQEESVDADGGYLVPTPLLPEVIRIVETYGVARRICRVIPMDRQKLDLTRKATGPAVSWPDEGDAPAANTKATFSRASLEAKKMMALDEISMEVQDDAVVDVAAYLMDLFGEAVAAEEDKQAFNSTTPFTGLLQTANVPVHDIASTTFTGNMKYSDFVATKYKASAFVARQGTWLMSTDVLSEVEKIIDADGRPLFKELGNGPASANGIGTILGRPVELSEVMPGLADDATDVPILAYGDFRFLMIGDRRQVSMDFSDEAGFTKATRMMRVLQRVAFVTALPAAFSIMKTA